MSNTTDNKTSSEKSQKQLMANALTALKKAQAKVKSLQQAQKEPIAIIGMACKLPGQMNDLQSVANKLSQGIDAVTDIPFERWDSDHYYSQDPQEPGKMLSNQGGFIGDADKFDNQFFKMSPLESKYLDPQHRLLMTHVWHALENANLVPSELYQQPVGTFIGISTLDYAQVIANNIDDSDINAYMTSGNIHSMAVGRIASYFGFIGPAIPIDTACSSSLIAVHQACENLRNQSCNLALVGGVNAIYDPQISIAFSKAQMLAKDGRCKTFDQNADGYVRGEGVGVLVLKRLSDAEQDNDNILAIIKGSATNHNGPSGGVTVPSGAAQQQVIEQAIKNADLTADDIDCIEAHGTGTSLGDPIELRALNQIFATGTRHEALAISSIKTNIGHLEAAAGIAGMIKMIAQLQNKQIYQHLNFNHATEHFDWQNSPLKVPTEAINWPLATTSDKPAIGGVSSYGINGSNAHVILNQAPVKAVKPQKQEQAQTNLNVLTIAAKSPEALARLAGLYHQLLSTIDTSDYQYLARLCYTSNVARSHFHYRLAVNLQSPAALATLKQNAAQTTIQARSNQTVLLLTGNTTTSNQYQQHQNYQAHYHTCIEHDCDETFAHEYALAKTLIECGLTPQAIMGSGKGEVVAACLNEQITLAQANNALKRLANNAKSTLDISNDQLIVTTDNSLPLTSDQASLVLSNPADDLAKLYNLGIELNWQAIHGEASYHKVQLPNYPFEQERFWIETKEQSQPRSQSKSQPWLAQSQQVANQLIALFNQGEHVLATKSVLVSDELEQVLLGFLHHFTKAHINNERSLAANLTPWFKQTKVLLNQVVDKSTLPSIDECWQQWQDFYQQLESQEELKVYGLLINTCLNRLEDMLSGKVKPAEVLFPNGSMELMEGLYKRTAQSDLFNGVLHQSAISYVKEKITNGNSIDILEVGAGTGGTTAGLMPLLTPFNENINQYCYTDLSPSFLRHGQQNYGQGKDYFTTQLLNIENAPNSQDFAPQSYDIIIATNVLHATKDIKTTLKHVKSLLRPGGILLLNEVLELKQLPSHLSIALLEGWWRFEDEDLRMPGSPALYPQVWQQVLSELGFNLVEFPAESVHPLGQQIIVAQSDGVVEQSLLCSQVAAKCTDELVDDMIDDLINAQSSTFTTKETKDKITISSSKAHINENIAAQLEAYLSEMVANALHMPAAKIDRQTTLENYGIDSIVISQLFGQLQSYFSDITVNLFFDYNRIDTIAKYLLAQYPAEVANMLAGDTPEHQLKNQATNKAQNQHDQRKVTCIKPCDNPKARLLVFHPFGFGHQSIEWMKNFDEPVEIWAVGSETHNTWQALTADLASQIKHLFDKPIIAWGHSMGATVAFETLSYLQQNHQLRTEQLIISSSSITLFERLKFSDPFYQFDQDTDNQTILENLATAHILPPKALIKSIAPDSVLNDVHLCKSYQRNKNTKLAADITIVQANNDILLPDPSVMLDWQQVVTGNSHYQEIDGTHLFFTRPPKAFVQLLKRQYQQAITSINTPSIKAGVYQLTDLAAGTEDMHTTPFGRNPKGILIYDENGNSALHAWHPKRPTNCFGPPFDSERYLTYFAYGGSYKQQSGIVEHRVQTCLVPNWDGKTLRRTIEQNTPPDHGFSLLTGPVINQQEQQYGIEMHQKLKWQPLNEQPQAKLSPQYIGPWQLLSLSGDDSFNGQCLITEQGIISVLINPKARTELNSQNLYYVSDEQIETILSQSIHLLLSVKQVTTTNNENQARLDYQVLVAQCCQAIEPAIVKLDLQGDKLTLSFVLQQGEELTLIWERAGLEKNGFGIR